MGLFRKTLEDVDRFVEQNDFKSALQTINQHMVQELNFKSSLNVLKSSLLSFDSMLHQLKDNLEAVNQTPLPKGIPNVDLEKQAIRRMINHLQRDVLNMKTEIRELLKERIRLE